MVYELVAILWAPFLMCLVLTGIHAYLGVHVLTRDVVFVDIAMAQIAALGATAAFLMGHETDTWQSYFYALGATFVGAVVLALTRSRRRRVSQEAIIGVVYAVSSAAAVLLSDRAAHGAEQVRGMLVGNLLSVAPLEVAKVAGLYALVGFLHWLCRRPFFLISTDPDAAYSAGWRVRLWDLLFYASFGVVVASSVRIAGVLLVFSYLIVPALAGVALGRSISSRLLIGWSFGTVVSVLGMVASAALDLPTGATVVCVFGLTLIVFGVGFRLGWMRSQKAMLSLCCLVPFAILGCAAIVPIEDVGDLAGEWKGRISSPVGNAPAAMLIGSDGAYKGTMFLDRGDQGFHGSLVAVRPGHVRYQGTDGNGTLRVYEDAGRRVLKFLRDGGGIDAVFSR